MLFLLLGCGQAPADTAADAPVTDTIPAITEASVACDVGEARWDISVQTDAWTGNGRLLLSADGVWIEQHPMYSSSAAADGASDQLDLTLTVVPDWRDVEEGSSTAFNCAATGLTGVIQVWTRDGADVADCRAFGDAPERWEAWSASAACATTLEEAGAG